MKHVDAGSLPSCPLSTQCQRLVNDLDTPGVATPRQFEQFTYTDDARDERLLRQLRAHVYSCPTCSAVLSQARALRAQQRALLHDFLVENEGEIPSTTLSILSAVRRESEAQEVRPQSKEKSILHSLEKVSPGPFVHLLSNNQEFSPDRSIPTRSTVAQSFHPLRNVVALATVAAVIIAAIGLFDHFTNRVLESGNKPIPRPAPASGGGEGWTSVVVGLTMVSTASFAIYNFDPDTGQAIPWYASTPGSDVHQIYLDGISRTGQHLLYQNISADGQTRYSTLPAASTAQDLYTLAVSHNGGAIWMDENHVLIADAQNGVFKVDIQTGLVEEVLASRIKQLEFYQAPYLYFVAITDSGKEALYRVNLSVTHDTAHWLTSEAPGTNFWLSPDGTTIFFAEKSSSEAQGIYALNNDGSHKRLLRSGPGVPVGYAADNALMLMEGIDGKFQLIQMGETPNQKEHVVLTNAAPGATSLCGPSATVSDTAICANNIALSPYGGGLVLHAYYANGAHSVLYDDLATGISKTLIPLVGNIDVQLPGWDRVPVPVSASATTSAASAGNLPSYMLN